MNRSPQPAAVAASPTVAPCVCTVLSCCGAGAAPCIRRAAASRPRGEDAEHLVHKCLPPAEAQVALAFIPSTTRSASSCIRRCASAIAAAFITMSPSPVRRGSGCRNLHHAGDDALGAHSVIMARPNSSHHRRSRPPSARAPCSRKHSPFEIWRQPGPQNRRCAANNHDGPAWHARESSPPSVDRYFNALNTTPARQGICSNASASAKRRRISLPAPSINRSPNAGRPLRSRVVPRRGKMLATHCSTPFPLCPVADGGRMVHFTVRGRMNPHAKAAGPCRDAETNPNAAYHRADRSSCSRMPAINSPRLRH